METIDLQILKKVTKDVREASSILTVNQARYLVDMYYLMQTYRISADGQVRSMNDSEEPNEVIQFFSDNIHSMESWIKNCLDKYVKNHVMGEWLYSHKGIGPVLAAGLLAHIDIEKAPTAGHIWSFAGLNPEKKWEKKTKRPYNARLKVLFWKIGCSFQKVSGYDDAFYGKLYQERKAYEVARNESGKNADAAKQALEKNIGKDTEAYKSYIVGKLPPAHVDARARRWVVKIFASHLQQVWYKKHYGKDAPAPFPIAILGHAHMIEAPL